MGYASDYLKNREKTTASGKNKTGGNYASAYVEKAEFSKFEDDFITNSESRVNDIISALKTNSRLAINLASSYSRDIDKLRAGYKKYGIDTSSLDEHSKNLSPLFKSVASAELVRRSTPEYKYTHYSGDKNSDEYKALSKYMYLTDDPEELKKQRDALTDNEFSAKMRKKYGDKVGDAFVKYYESGWLARQGYEIAIKNLLTEDEWNEFKAYEESDEDRDARKKKQSEIDKHITDIDDYKRESKQNATLESRGDTLEGRLEQADKLENYTDVGNGFYADMGVGANGLRSLGAGVYNPDTTGFASPQEEADALRRYAYRLATPEQVEVELGKEEAKEAEWAPASDFYIKLLDLNDPEEQKKAVEIYRGKFGDEVADNLETYYSYDESQRKNTQFGQNMRNEIADVVQDHVDDGAPTSNAELVKGYIEWHLNNDVINEVKKLQEAPDFEENSKLKGARADDSRGIVRSKGSSVYNLLVYLNNNNNSDDLAAVKTLGGRAVQWAAEKGELDEGAQKLYDEYTLSQVTAEELPFINYIYNKQGEEAVLKYFEDTKHRHETANRNKYKTAYNWLYDKADEASPVLGAAVRTAGSIYSVGLAPIAGIEGLVNISKWIADLRPWDHKKAETSDSDTLISDIRGGIRGAITDDLGEMGGLLYGTGMSILDVAANIAFSYGVGELASLGVSAINSAAGIAETASAAATSIAESASSAATTAAQQSVIRGIVEEGKSLSLILMSSSAATPAYQEALDRGLDETHARWMGVVAAAAEYITEMFSIEAFLSDPHRIISYLAKNSFTEASEEGASDLLNTFADAIINGGNSEIRQRMREIMVNDGYGEDEAFSIALAEWTMESGMDVAGGLISGLTFGLFGVSKMAKSDTGTGAALNFTSKDNTEDKAKIAGAGAEALANDVIARYGADSYEGKKAQSALDKLAEGKPLSNRQVGELTRFAAENMVETGEVNDIGEAYGVAQMKQFGAMDDKAFDIGTNKAVTKPMFRSQFEGETGVKLDADDEENARRVKEYYGRYTATQKQSDKVTLDRSDVTAIASINGRQVVYETADGNIRADDVQFSDETTANLFDEATGFDLVTANAFIDNYANSDAASDLTLGQYNEIFTNLHDAGKLGVYDSVNAMLADNATLVKRIGVRAATVAYNTGVQYAERSNYEGESSLNYAADPEFAGKIAEKTRNGTKYTAEEAEALTEIIRRATEKIKVNGKIVTLDDPGRTVPALAAILISDDANNAYGTLLHEMFEVAHLRDAKLVGRARDAVIGWYAEQQGAESADALVKRYQARYAEGEGAKSYASAENEVFFDAIGGLFSTEEGIKQFSEWLDTNETAEGKKTILTTIAEILKRIADFFRSAITKSTQNKAQSEFAALARENEAKATEIRKMLLDVLDTTTAKAVSEGTAVSGEVSENNEVRNQIETDDAEYLFLAEKYRDGTATAEDEAKLRAAVEAQARVNGFDSPMLYHGTNAFGFTRINTTTHSDDRFSFWASNSKDTSATYTPYGDVRQIAQGDADIADIADNIEEKIDDGVDEFRRLIDHTFSEWVFGQTDNSYLLDQVSKANPEPGKGDGVYDVLDEIVVSAYYDYIEYFQDEYEDLAAWQENSPEAEKIYSAIYNIEALRKAQYDLERGNYGGIYQLYGKTDNFYEMDAKGVAWNELRPENLPKIDRYGIKDVPYKTRDVAEWANKNGYDGVLFKNIRDNGEYGRTPSSDVYAFFKPNTQVKSADLVTYDDDGEIIPLSKRFTESDDIRHQIDVDSPKYESAIRENQQLRDLVTDLVEQTKATTSKKRVLAKDVRAEAVRILTDNDSRYDRDTLMDDLKRIRAMALETRTAEDIEAYAYDVAKRILAESEHNAAPDEVSAEIARTIKSVPVRLSQVQRNALMRRYGMSAEEFAEQFGDFITIDQDGEGLTQRYRELAKEYPSLFDASVKAEEIPLVFAEAAKALSENYEGDLTLDEEASLLSAELLATAYALPQAKTTADAYRGRIAEVRREYTAKVKEYRAQANEAQRGKARAEARADRAESRVNDVREKAQTRLDERLAAQKAKFDARVRANKESRKDQQARTQLRQNARKLAKDLADRMANPKKGKYIPKDLVDLVIKVADAIDNATSLRLTQEDYEAIREERAGGATLASLAEKYGVTNNTISKIVKDEDVTYAHTTLDDYLRQIKESYHALKNGETEYRMAWSQPVQDMVDQLIGDLASEKQSQSLRSMNYRQLEIVNRLLNLVRNTVLTAVEAKAYEKTQSLIEAGENLIDETDDVGKGFANAVSTFFSKNFARPKDLFETLAGYKKDSYWSGVYKMLNEAQRNELRFRYEGYDALAEVLDFSNKETRKNYRKMQSTKKSDLLDVGLTDRHGNAVLISHGIAAELYASLMREDNRRHIMFGGFTLPNMDDMYDGKNGYDKGKTRILGNGEELAAFREEYNEAVKREATEEEIQAIEQKYADAVAKAEQKWRDIATEIWNQLTDYDKAWLRATEYYYNTVSKAQINAMSNEMYGFDLATVEDYYPILTDPNFRPVSDEVITRDESLENAGNLKRRVFSGNPIYIGDIALTADRQIKRVSREAAYTAAISDYNKMRSTTLPRYKESVQNVVEDKFGKDMNEKLAKIVRDMIGHTKKKGAADVFAAKLRGKAAGATLMMNIGVSMGQAGSYPTAAAVIGYKPLLKALAINPDTSEKGERGHNKVAFWRANIDLINKYTPMLRYRKAGNAATGFEHATSRPSLEQRAPALFGWIEAVDTATVGRLWSACEFYVNDKFSDLKAAKENSQADTDAYYTKVAEVFNQVVEETQPNYTTLQRPSALRSDSEVTKMMMMYFTQRLQNFNIFYSGIARYAKYVSDYKKGKNGVTKADVKQARLGLVHGVTAVLAGQLVYRVFRELADFIQHIWKNAWDEDEEEYRFDEEAQNALHKYIGDLVGNVPIISQLYDIVDSAMNGSYFDGVFDAVGLENLNTLSTDVYTIIKNWHDDEKEVSFKNVEDFIFDIVTTFGLPAKNAKKLYEGVRKWSIDAEHGELGYGGEFDLDDPKGKLEYALSGRADIKETVNSVYNELYEAETAEFPGKTEAELKHDVTQEVKRRFGNIVRDRYKAAYAEGDYDTMYEIQQQMRESGLYDDIKKACDNWTSAYDEEQRKRGLD